MVKTINDRAATHHELKCWRPYFDDVASGAKSFELRRDDRGFKVGDWLTLHETERATDAYTGRAVDVVVTYILRGVGILPVDFCILGIEIKP